MGDLPLNTPGQLGPTRFPAALRQEAFPWSHGRRRTRIRAVLPGGLVRTLMGLAEGGFVS